MSGPIVRATLTALGLCTSPPLSPNPIGQRGAAT